MDHVAIMKKSWGLIPKIINGQKKIESRWFKTKHLPWDKVRQGDVIYFKNSGEPIEARATIEKVIQLPDLTSEKVKEVLEKYAKSDGLGIEDIPKFFNLFRDKKYCILIFLKNPERTKLFEIDKTGFGAMAAWIAVDDINKIKKEIF